MRPGWFGALLVVPLALISPPPTAAQTAAPDLTRMSLEDLMNIEITSASRKEQRANDAAAAVYVITREDIRRSGFTTVPELFRLVPGMQVAQINSNSWAISVRGFNDLWANQLLVLIDGRSVYTRTYSGVLWSMQDLLLEDIERIEIVRGPGGSVWGANAVNGVINIITRASDQTQGTLVRVGGGTADQGQAAVRYGGALGGATYRVFSQWNNHSASLDDRRGSAGDEWHHFSNGFRLDWSRGANSVTTEGTLVNGAQYPLWTPVDGPAPSLSARVFEQGTSHDGSLLARWTHSLPGGSAVHVQSFYDVSERIDGNGVRQNERVSDLDVELHARPGARHDVVLGGGIREFSTNITSNFIYSAAPSSDNVVLNAFVQDDVHLTKGLQLTVGSKVEQDEFAGWGVQPTVRLLQDLGRRDQRIWAAVSRALRTPSLNDRGIRVNYAAFRGSTGVPVVLGFTGNPEYQTEHLLNAEAGYRVAISPAASLDVAAFRGHYTGLKTNEPVAPVMELTPGPAHLFIGTRLANLLDADTTGVEVAGHWTPSAVWRLDGSYSGLRITPLPDAASLDAAAAHVDGNAPRHQWQIRSTFTLAPRAEVNLALYHVGRLGLLGVPSYTRADARLELKAARNVSVIATGQNLLAPAHAEFADAGTGLAATLVPRSASLGLRFALGHGR